MIIGTVDENGIPVIHIEIGDSTLRAVIDTGFNGDLEPPESLRSEFDLIPAGQRYSILAAGQTAFEELFLIRFPFDGRSVLAETTFVETDEILIGTELLEEYRLEINFVQSTVLLERVDDAGA